MRCRRLNGAVEKVLWKGAPSHKVLLAEVCGLAVASVAHRRGGSVP